MSDEIIYFINSFLKKWSWHIQCLLWPYSPITTNVNTINNNDTLRPTLERERYQLDIILLIITVISMKVSLGLPLMVKSPL